MKYLERPESTLLLKEESCIFLLDNYISELTEISAYIPVSLSYGGNICDLEIK